MKRSKAEIRDELLKIDTGFKDENGEKVGVDSFASFLVTKDDFPTNKEIEKHFSDKDGNIKHFVPSDVQKDLFSKELFAFPENYFDDSDFHNDYMFAGINAAFRKGHNDYKGWGNFRDIKNPTNTYKLYIQTNNALFKGCYITDIVKNVIDSRADNVTKQFFGKNKLSESDNDILSKSMEIFIKECLVIRPNKKLIVFGGAAENALKKMSNSDSFKEILKRNTDNDEDYQFVMDLIGKNHVEITHYSLRMKLDKWIVEEPQDLLDKVAEK